MFNPLLQALISAHERSVQYQDLLGSVKGAIFFAVPHKGSSVATLGVIATNILRYTSVGFFGNSNFLKDLRTKSASLDRIGQAFVERGTFPIHTFFETEKTGNKIVCAISIYSEAKCIMIDQFITPDC
jgi:hypothetical protein